MTTALLALAGLAAGIAAKAGDESGRRWAADLGSYPAAWVLAVALIGWAAPGVRSAAGRAAVFFAAMTVAYYGWAALVLHFGWDVRLLLSWLVLSATAVPVTAAAVHRATRSSGRLAGALLAAAAGVVLGGGALGEPGQHPVQAVADVLVAAVLALGLPRDRPTRVWALVLTGPLTWLAARALDVLQSALG